MTRAGVIVLFGVLALCLAGRGQGVGVPGYGQNTPAASAARQGEDRFDAVLRRAGWRPEDIAARTLSRSGRYLVIAASAPGTPRVTDNTDLYLIDLEGKVRELTDDTAGYTFVKFSGDELLVAYASRGGVHTSVDTSDQPPDIPWTVYVQSVLTGNRHEVFRQKPVPPGAPGAAVYCWLPRTHALLYGAANPAGLYLINAAGGVPERVAAEAPDAVLPARHYLYRIDRQLRTLSVSLLPTAPAQLQIADTWRHLRSYGPFAFPAVPYCAGIGHGDRLELSSDGKQVAFFLTIKGGPGRKLVVLDLRTGRIRPLGAVPAAYSEFVWTRDGAYLLCTRRGPKNGRYGIDVRAVPARPLRSVAWRNPAQADIEPAALVLPP